MKRILSWAEEEKITIMVFLLGIGIILNSPPPTFVLGGLFIYGAIIFAILHLLHRLYLKFKKR